MRFFMVIENFNMNLFQDELQQVLAAKGAQEIFLPQQKLSWVWISLTFNFACLDEWEKDNWSSEIEERER